MCISLLLSLGVIRAKLLDTTGQLMAQSCRFPSLGLQVRVSGNFQLAGSYPALQWLIHCQCSPYPFSDLEELLVYFTVARWQALHQGKVKFGRSSQPLSDMTLSDEKVSDDGHDISKKFMMMVESHLRKFQMMVMTYLKIFRSCKRHI